MQEAIRHSLADPASRGSVISLEILGTLESKDVEFVWSWTYLQSQFKSDCAELLFDKYRSRLRHSNFVLVLLLSIFHSSIEVVRALASKLKPSFSTVFAPVFCAGVSAAFLMWSFSEKHFTKNRLIPIISASGISILLFLEEYGALLGDCLYAGTCDSVLIPRLSSATYLILLFYFLPLLKNRYVTIVFGLTTVILDVLVSTRLLGLDFYKIAPDLGTYVFLNAIGFVKQFVDEITQRRAFLDLRCSIESKLKLDFEKDKEEKLILTIIPKHFSESLKRSVRKEIESAILEHTKPKQRSFADMYIMSYDNVSILFADIVSFTKLTQTLDVTQLITTLNELFGRFDEVSEKNNCLRIKIIGDCYYCISGIPEISEVKDFGNDGDSVSSSNGQHPGQHALNCVNTGLEIIQVIRNVRDKFRVPQLDMRIGIHSGHVHCGLLGLVKWQYDIWSRDVTIANILEQTGQPGKVHISEITNKLLNGSIETYPARGRESHPYLEGMDTFFVLTPVLSETSDYYFKDQHDGYRRYSTAPGTQIRRGSIAPVQKRAEMMHKINVEAPAYRSSATVSISVLEFNKLKETVNNQLDKAIGSMAISKREQWLEQNGIHPVFLHYQQWNLEPAFIKQVDPLFKYNLVIALILYVAIIFLAYYGFWPAEEFGRVWLNSYPIAIGSAVIMAFLLTVCFLSWHNFFTKHLKEKTSEIESSTENYLSWFSSYLQRVSDSFNKNFWIRKLVFLAVCSSILTWLTFASIDAVHSSALRESPEINKSSFTTINPQVATESQANNITVLQYRSEQVLIHARVVTFNFALLLVVVSAFMRTHYMLKFIVKGIVLGMYTVFACNYGRSGNSKLIWEPHFVHDPVVNNWNTAYIDHILFLSFIFGLLHLEDRQLEYFGRLDYLWKCKVIEEKKEATRTAQVNRFLLLNILPEHLATKYLNNQQTSDVYHENYQNVSVMFASIPNFTDFYQESDITSKGLRCLQMLNEIINDFDKILFDGNRFERIEKVKMVGSTYMAAAGLLTGRRTSIQNEGASTDDPDLNVELLIEFAICMMEQLDKINKDAIQDFQLRIGIACGPVIAGVVGEHKPFYDIWGDTVNVASRMDSTGVIGRIQVTAECAEILMEGGYDCELRGNIMVKGKEGGLTTYFVKTPYDKREEFTRL